MIKKIILVISFIPLALNAVESPLRSFRFVEANSIKELSSLPPKLELTLEIMCNEEFIKVVRHDSLDPISKKVTIAVGALVRENMLKSCAGEVKIIKVPAGETFSGKEFELSKIKRQWALFP